MWARERYILVKETEREKSKKECFAQRERDGSLERREHIQSDLWFHFVLS